MHLSHPRLAAVLALSLLLPCAGYADEPTSDPAEILRGLAPGAWITVTNRMGFSLRGALLGSDDKAVELCDADGVKRHIRLHLISGIEILALQSADPDPEARCAEGAALPGAGPRDTTEPIPTPAEPSRSEPPRPYDLSQVELVLGGSREADYAVYLDSTARKNGVSFAEFEYRRSRWAWQVGLEIMVLCTTAAVGMSLINYYFLGPSKYDDPDDDSGPVLVDDGLLPIEVWVVAQVLWAMIGAGTLFSGGIMAIANSRASSKLEDLIERERESARNGTGAALTGIRILQHRGQPRGLTLQLRF